jgi:hypothetical protein
MEEILKRIRRALGVRTPSVPKYKKAIKKLTEQEAEQLRRDIFSLAFVYWDDLRDDNEDHRDFKLFLLRFFRSDRQLVQDYVMKHTILGAIRYKPQHPELFISMLHIIEEANTIKGMSCKHLSSAVLMAFDFDLKVNTLNNYICNNRIDAEKIMELTGRIEIV